MTLGNKTSVPVNTPVWACKKNTKEELVCVCLCWLISSWVNTYCILLKVALRVWAPLTLPDQPVGRLASAATVSLISSGEFIHQVVISRSGPVFLSLLKGACFWPALLFISDTSQRMRWHTLTCGLRLKTAVVYEVVNSPVSCCSKLVEVNFKSSLNLQTVWIMENNFNLSCKYTSART